MALITLIRRRGIRGGRRTKLALAALGVFGASLFFGDSMITPAISVLSAIEGVKVAAPSLSNLVVPITAGTRVHGGLLVFKAFLLLARLSCPLFPALPAFRLSSLNGKEGVSGSSPEEGLNYLQIQATFVVCLGTGPEVVMEGVSEFRIGRHFGSGGRRIGGWREL
jgi:KUP system potassium uptake protein